MDEKEFFLHKILSLPKFVNIMGIVGNDESYPVMISVGTD